MENKTNKERFETDPTYRKQVVRELEGEGTIERMDNHTFGQVVYGTKNDNVSHKG